MESHFPNLPAPHQSQLARERVLEDVRTLVKDGESLLKATAGDLSRTAVAARQRLETMLGRARAFMAEVQLQGLQSARIAVTKAETTVKEHPFASLAAAFGVGICVGALLASRRRR